MKNTRFMVPALLAVVTLFMFMFAAPVSANTTNLSFDPVYAQGPFAFYCSQYTESFVSDEYYGPADGGCIYSVPQSIVGQRVIGLYRGTVGNATFLSGGLVSGFPTLVRDDFIPFSAYGLQPEDVLFAVVYDYSIFGTSLHPYLLGSGPLPANAVANQNYFVLPWKWTDAEPPMIEIVAPEQGVTYLTSDSIVPETNITDNTAVATSTHFFNGVAVDPTLPLLFASAPLGSNTFSVTATDTFGNVGTNQVTFTIEGVPPPPDTTPPVIDITSPAEVGTMAYTRNDIVYVTATITDNSAIVSTIYKFDGVVIDPINPLPLATAFYGAHTISVTATDSANNTSTKTVEFFVVPWDTGGPSITINVPMQGAVYSKNAIIMIDADIVDPEGSAITSRSFLFNSAPVDSLLPLPFSTTPIGTSMLEVTATDEHGNVGQATSTFAIQLPTQATSTLTAVADTYLRAGGPNTNEGGSPILRVQGAGDNRILVRFDQDDIEDLVAGGTVLSASLELDIEDSKNNWGPWGREVAIHRLTSGWSEGDGKNAEFPAAESIRGSGSGATWNCAKDADIANHLPDCSSTDDWNMRLKKKGTFGAPWVEEQTDGVVIHRGEEGTISYDVTADINAFLTGSPNYGWIVMKSLTFRPGYITFFSKDSGEEHAPRLIVRYIPGN